MRLLERAGGRIAVTTTDDPDLHLVIDGRRLDPVAASDDGYSFAVDRAPVASLRLCSRHGVPSLLGITPHDHRRLGVAVARIVISQPALATVIEHDSALLAAAGLYPPEPGHCWTDGELALPAHLFAHLAGAFTLTVEVERPGMRYPLPEPLENAA